MDKSWASFNPFTEDYRTGLAKFISNSLEVASHEGNIKCPCAKCLNRFWLSNKEVEAHLIVEGMDRSYLQGLWVWHGETFGDPLPSSEAAQQLAAVNTPHSELGPLLEDIFFGPSVMGGMPTNNHSEQEAPIPAYARKFEAMVQDANTELYPGCGMKKMDFLIRVFQNKCLYGCSESAVQANLQLLKHILLNGHSLPKKIHACENDCMLYWKHNSGLDVCPTCGVSKYTTEVDDTVPSSKKRIPRKVLTYFPITPRLQRLYMSRHTSEDMCWHGLSQPEDGYLRHPADSFAWKQLYLKFPTFGGEMHNVRLGLAILLTIYNLPPWLCMKSPFILMTLLIPGKESPGNDIDVYLQPLIDELKVLWTFGVPTYDTFRQETFTLRAAFLWTISDFPAYGNLSGWSTHGKLACLHCNYNTESTYLKKGRKYYYRGHRRFLPMSHVFRQQRKTFNLSDEREQAPSPMTGRECLRRLSTLRFKYGKTPWKQVGEKRPPPTPTVGPWKKHSIFFQLPYWEHLVLRHCLNVMHIEKNVTESLVATLLGIVGKSKDNMNARLNLELMGMKPELHIKFVNGKPKMPPGAYTMKPLEKELFCKVLASIKVPDNYSSNISRLVHVREKIVRGLKSHDWHVLMQQFLPIAIRKSLPSGTAHILLELSAFFRHLCIKKGSVEGFHKLTPKIVMILCQLERILPPAFFVVSLHLIIHIVEEAALAGPMHYKWMYPIERFLLTLKKYVQNKNRPEGSMTQGYLAEEYLSFCAMCLKGVETSLNRPSRNVDRLRPDHEGDFDIFCATRHSLGIREDYHLDNHDWEIARSSMAPTSETLLLVLQSDIDFIFTYRRRRVTMLEAEKEAIKSFPDWFENHVNQLQQSGDPSATDDLVALANGPRKWCRRYKIFVCNGFRFKVRGTQSNGNYQNYGVFLQSDVPSYAGPHDRNPFTGLVNYYGVLTDVFEIKYHMERTVVLFKCNWFNGTSRNTGEGVKTDRYGFRLVNFNKMLSTSDPFILASQALQVFYVQDPTYIEWHVAIKTRPRDFFDMSSTHDDDPCDGQDVEHATGDNDEVIQKMMRYVLINDLYSEIHRLKQEVYAAIEKNGIYIPRHRYVSEEAEKKIEQMELDYDSKHKLEETGHARYGLEDKHLKQMRPSKSRNL
ncbi:unnamed protein product [Malus baccata var. baccata]